MPPGPREKGSAELSLQVVKLVLVPYQLMDSDGLDLPTTLKVPTLPVEEAIDLADDIVRDQRPCSQIFVESLDSCCGVN